VAASYALKKPEPLQVNNLLGRHSLVLVLCMFLRCWVINGRLLAFVAGVLDMAACSCTIHPPPVGGFASLVARKEEENAHQLEQEKMA
jgi:hypothetical protein